MFSASISRRLIDSSRMPIYKSCVLFLVILLANLAQSKLSEKSGQISCSNKTSCGNCIQTKNCAWCSEHNFNGGPRCFVPNLITYRGCGEEYILNPGNTEDTLLDEMLTVAEPAVPPISGRRIVQIAPQRVSLKLKMNEEHRFDFRYSQAEDYPVDLYYLMDLSKSVEDYREKLSKLGNLISGTIPNITSNFRLGFGSYVDKVSTITKNPVNLCESCDASYGYRNHMTLSTDKAKFSENVRKAAFSGMVGALDEQNFYFDSTDAMMQAVVCQDQIGWRDQARRLLVLSTNNDYGMLREGVPLNDGKCHLDSKGEYDHSTVLDFPSISQINFKIVENTINVIFAVTPQQADVYGKLAKHIDGSSSAFLADDSSNVVELAKEQYNKISSTVEIRDNATNAIKITYYSACKGNGAAVPTSKCEGLKFGDIVNFTAEIIVTFCPPYPEDWFQTIKIYPVGTNDSLIINLEMLCGCGCENPDHPLFEYNSAKCNGHGTYKCGICDCDESYTGQMSRNCQC